MTRETLVVSILTILASGVVAGIVTFQLNARRDERQLLRIKLEDLFKAFNGFSVDLKTHWVPYLSTMASRISYEQLHELEIQHAPKEKHFPNIELLTAIYFPDLRHFLDQLVSIRDSANEVIARHRREYELRGIHRSDELENLSRISGHLTQLQDDFRLAVHLKAKRLNRKLPGHG